MVKMIRLILVSVVFMLTAGIVSATESNIQLTISNDNLSGSYKVAGLQWLPDFIDSEFGWSGNKIPERPAPSGDCAAYPLTTCPANALCESCPFGSSVKITGCQKGFKLSNSTCIAESCDKVNSAYRGDVPAGKICSIVSGTSLTCYQSCTNVSCSGYNVATCPNGAVCTRCPDCEATSTKKGNCSPDKLKVTSCTSVTQKVNSDATACIDKDNSCPSSHPNKSCSTSSTSEITNEAGNKCYTCRAADNTCPSEYPDKSCANGSTGQITNEAGNACYKCKEITSCTDYIKSAYPDFSILTSSSLDYMSSGNVVIMNNASSTSPLMIASGKKIVGPKYFNHSLCLSAPTPILSFSIRTGDGVTLKNGTLANVEVEYKPTGYVPDDVRPSVYCEIYTSCTNSGSSSNDVYARIAAYLINGTSPETIFGNSSSSTGWAINAVNACKNGNSYPTSCDSYGYGSCACSSVVPAICAGLEEQCKQNYGSAVAGYGTIKDVVINKSKTQMNVVVSPDGGDLIFDGNVKLFAASRDTPMQTGSSNYRVERSNGGIIVNGLLDIYSDRGIQHGNSRFVVNSTGTLKISYGSWQGISSNAGNPIDVYGKLDISSHGSGGTYNNDIEFNKNVMNLKSTGSLILKNGAGGSGGYTGSVTSGTLNFEGGSKLTFGSNCKKSVRNGTVSVGDRAKPNNLYGNFTSHPAAFSGTCVTSGTNDCSASIRPTPRTCNGISYLCGSGSATIDCGLVIDGIGGCVPLDTCK